MCKKKEVIGNICLSLGLILFVVFSMHGTYSIDSFGDALGKMIYSRIVGVLMIFAGVILLLTRKKDTRFSAVFSAMILTIAAFITFNEYEPSSIMPFAILRIANIVMAFVLFFAKTNKQQRNEYDGKEIPDDKDY